MWLFFGSLAIIFAILNILWISKGKDSKLFMFISLSFTALTLCALLQQDGVWVAHEDWGALMDTTPIMTKIYWIFTVSSIIINSISIIPIKN